MKPLLLPHMPGAPFGDPALLVEILWEHRALLFDLGEVEGFPPGKLVKVSHAFVSHTHIDHFVGFDLLLRLMLNREHVLKIFGPPGFLSNVHGKLSGYTWNLTGEYPFSIQACEVHPERMVRRTFPCRDRFAPGPIDEQDFTGLLEDDGQIQFHAVHLDHLIPSLGYALQERFHINVHKDRLIESGFPPGPWLRELKQALWRGESPDFPVWVPSDQGGRQFPLGRLLEFVSVVPGQKMAYVADCRFSPDNAQKIISLARGADVFFCEAAFLDQDRERAAERAHLTARQAGELARAAQVKKLAVFHFSPRYEGQGDLLYREAEEAYQGGAGRFRGA